MEQTEIKSWVRLSLEPGLKHAQRLALLANFGLPDKIYASSSSSLAKFVDPVIAAKLASSPNEELQATITATTTWLQGNNNHIISLADKNYPKALLNLADPPIIIYAKGNVSCLAQHKIALVGARSATPQGLENAQAFALYLARRGWCIVSGMASGIDAAAHIGAIKSTSPNSTIAVLGTGIDLVYPPANKNLAEKIATAGLLISELPLGYPAIKHNFPRRNRLVAALSYGVVIVEATKRSGSLITARLAGELGREVYAIPGSIHSPQSRGCHQLIRQGAKLVESGQDIIEELEQAKLPLPQQGTGNSTDQDYQQGKSAELTSLDSDSNSLLNAMGYEASSLEDIQARTGWHISKILQKISQLELKGLINRHTNGQYIKSSGSQQ